MSFTHGTGVSGSCLFPSGSLNLAKHRDESRAACCCAAQQCSRVDHQVLSSGVARTKALVKPCPALVQTNFFKSNQISGWDYRKLFWDNRQIYRHRARKRVWLLASGFMRIQPFGATGWLDTEQFTRFTGRPESELRVFVAMDVGQEKTTIPQHRFSWKTKLFICFVAKEYSSWPNFFLSSEGLHSYRWEKQEPKRKEKCLCRTNAVRGRLLQSGKEPNTK